MIKNITTEVTILMFFKSVVKAILITDCAITIQLEIYDMKQNWKERSQNHDSVAVLLNLKGNI